MLLLQFLILISIAAIVVCHRVPYLLEFEQVKDTHHDIQYYSHKILPDLPRDCALVVGPTDGLHGQVHHPFDDVYPTTDSWTTGEEGGGYLGYYK